VATIKEVAKKARVSVGTVSNVLSGAVPVSKRLRERVLEVIKQLDYHPNHIARSLKIRQTKMIGMVVSDITNPFVPQLVRGAEAAAWRANYMLIVFNSDDQPEREQQVLAALRSRRVDGILLLAAAGSDRSHVAAVRDSGIPVVCVGQELPGLSLDCIVPDNFLGALECARHLIELGHRRIGMLSGDLLEEPARQRHVGYKQALTDSNIPYDESLIIQGGSRAEDGYRSAVELLSRNPRPTAMFTENAAVALGALRALKELNLQCPQDVALATFDDPYFAEALRPALTAVAQPLFEIGARAMGLLLERIADPTRKPEKLELQMTLNIRESSGTQRVAATS
jgi:LacI family transcriptional regulator